MPKATFNSNLSPIPECYIQVGDSTNEQIILNNLPEISDNKSAVYNSESVIGRSFPFYTYSHSDGRKISMSLHFFVVEPNDIQNNLDDLRLLQSAVYPREGNNGTPFTPPVVCKIKCGELLAKEPLCCVLESYSVKFPTEVAWSTESNLFTPFKFDVDTSWLTVYSSQNLPYNDRIIRSGR